MNIACVYQDKHLNMTTKQFLGQHKLLQSDYLMSTAFLPKIPIVL